MKKLLISVYGLILSSSIPHFHFLRTQLRAANPLGLQKGELWQQKKVSINPDFLQLFDGRPSRDGGQTTFHQFSPPRRRRLRVPMPLHCPQTNWGVACIVCRWGKWLPQSLPFTTPGCANYTSRECFPLGPLSTRLLGFQTAGKLIYLPFRASSTLLNAWVI